MNQERAVSWKPRGESGKEQMLQRRETTIQLKMVRGVWTERPRTLWPISGPLWGRTANSMSWKQHQVREWAFPAYHRLGKEGEIQVCSRRGAGAQEKFLCLCSTPEKSEDWSGDVEHSQ